jgi:hypothetical protein
MVSLGPLHPTRFCTYSCPFCYVHADFKSYASMEVEEIRAWLTGISEPFDIIYVSGDTDSFAPPRANKGIELLKALSQFDTDLLFTTRALLREDHLNELKEISRRLSVRGKLLFGCVSVAQLTFPHLEPPPIAAPFARLEQLRCFHEYGLIAVLAVRPFLPLVPVEEYIQIVHRAQDYADIVLGEAWYADKGGVLEHNVFRGVVPPTIPFVQHPMDFDDNGVLWKVFEANEAQAAVSEYCESIGVPFFMRSRPAIEWARANLPKQLTELVPPTKSL